MKCIRSIAVSAVVLTTLAAPQAMLAQRGRGGGAGAAGGGAVGRENAPSLPPASRESRGSGGNQAGMGSASSASSMKAIESSPELSKRLQSMLPPGSNLSTAATGFRNEGQFIAAVHVSHNLGIPFDQLKNQMTQGNGSSLGSAIRTLRPNMDKKTVSEQVKAAEHAAHDDMRAAKSGSK